MENTIAAICTPLGNGSISIIRLSGNESIAIANKIFRGKDLSKVNTHTINYGHIVDGEEMIDEVMVSVMKAPKTYTREDVVEINCHGGIVVTKKVLSLLLKNGAEIAEPGEFTKRAFLNGRIDLSQAEAVMDLINAKSDMAAKTSISQVGGSSQKSIRKMREEILNYIAFIEAALDDPEHYELNNYGNDIHCNINRIKLEIDKLINNAKNGRLIREGISTAIIGLPNAGKSSLLNYLAQKDRAIVTEIAGTTRDLIEEQVILDDIVLNVIDTAGIRETDDIVESIGVKRTLETIHNAELILYVIDGSEELVKENFEIFDSIKNKKSVAIINKIDKEIIIDIDEINKYTDNVISISLTESKSLELINDTIKNMVYNENILFNDELFLANERQLNLLEEAKNSINQVLNSIYMEASEDFLTIDLMDAYISLGKILGEEIEEDVINKIFKDFCMGK